MSWTGSRLYTNGRTDDMSSGRGRRKQFDGQITTDTEAEHSMVSEDDQLTVEERERKRDEISRAKPRQNSDDTVADRDRPKDADVPEDRR
jgi:hypothetical protein